MLQDPIWWTHPVVDQKCCQNSHQSDYLNMTNLEEDSQKGDTSEAEVFQKEEEDSQVGEDTLEEEEVLPELDP